MRWSEVRILPLELSGVSYSGRTADFGSAYGGSIPSAPSKTMAKDKEAQRTAQKAHYQKYREKYRERDRQRRAACRAFVETFKAKPCMDCKGSFPPVCMDFDHVRGEKIKDLSDACTDMWTHERLLEEIEKCDLVCSNCHRIRTEERRLLKVAQQ